MTNYKPIHKIDISLSTETFTDIYDDTAIWWLVAAAFIYYLADVLMNNTDIVNQFVSLIQETSLETAMNKAEFLDFTPLKTNIFTNNKINLPVNIRFDINCVQLIIFHAKEQWILLATVNPDFSINVHEQAIINEGTDAIDLNNIYDRFFNAFNIIVNSQTQPISIQTTIITKADLEFWYKSEPFIPILDVLTEYPFHLFAYMYDLPSLNLQLQNVGMNIFTLEIFESELIHQNGLLNNIITLSENIDLNRQPIWSYYQAHGQLWRYIVTIRDAYIVMG